VPHRAFRERRELIHYSCLRNAGSPGKEPVFGFFPSRSVLLLQLTPVMLDMNLSALIGRVIDPCPAELSRGAARILINMNSMIWIRIHQFLARRRPCRDQGVAYILGPPPRELFVCRFNTHKRACPSGDSYRAEAPVLTEPLETSNDLVNDGLIRL